MTKKTFKRKLNPNQEQTKLYDKITFLQTKIINKINGLKKSKNSFTLCDHMKIENDKLHYDKQANYYDKFWKEYLMIMVYIKRLDQFENSVSSLESSVMDIEKKFKEREQILNLPALSKIKKSISKLSKCKQISQNQPQKLQIIDPLQNSFVQLKKQEEVQPHLINYQSSENQIFYQ